MSNTYTSAVTIARLDLIKLQFKIALRRTTGISEHSWKKIEKGLSKGWIKTLNIYAFNSKGLCKAQIELEVDWHQHDVELRNGKTTIALDEGWINNTAIEVDEVIQIFKDYVSHNNLNIKWCVFYPSHLDADEINRKLGFVKAKPIKWSGKKEGANFSIPELKELRVGYYRTE